MPVASQPHPLPQALQLRAQGGVELRSISLLGQYALTEVEVPRLLVQCRRTPGRHRRAGERRTASKVVFPKHARLDGPKSFTNWLRQLRLALPNQVRGYVLDGVVPPTWTADQLAGPTTCRHGHLCRSQARFAPDDATRTLELFARLWDFRKMPASVEAYDTWLREYMSIAQKYATPKHRSTTFRLTFTGRAAKPTRPSRTHDAYGRIRIQLRSAGLSTSHSAMLATKLPCPLPRSRSPPARLHFTCEAPATGPAADATRKVTGHSTARTGVNRHVAATTPRTTRFLAASQPNVGYFASCLFARRQLPTDAFVVDSGATTHMVADRSLFTTYRQTAHTKIGGIAGGITAIGMGDVAFVAKTGHPITLRGVLHTPGLHVNLLSVSRLCDTDRVRLAFTSDGIDIAKDGRAIAHGTGSTTVFTFWTRITPSKMIAAGLLDGFGAGYSDKDVEEFVCNACLGSKVTAFPFPTLSRIPPRDLARAQRRPVVPHSVLDREALPCSRF
ncbi:BZ3500_MvSof-1268-A1-R1_C118g00645 [Microbotryum saponariae]|uniref:BZ3500_MvSof-1268-A1-R1_C118g00645 protein n=1 Tax=Microbotryum saponariae TaxID=289078 RepID=A0A2X0LHV8_9BASI|nr:BZ3500_MvSof-1268-A1-R1_C118g00645 [Microbotryum saponariae]